MAGPLREPALLVGLALGLTWVVLLRTGLRYLYWIERGGLLLIGTFVILQKYLALIDHDAMNAEHLIAASSWLAVLYALVYFLFEPDVAGRVAWWLWVAGLATGVGYAVDAGVGERGLDLMIQTYLAGAAMIVVIGRTVWTRAQVVQAHAQAEQYGRLAMTDELTGLANRRHFIDRARRSIDRADAGERGALFFIDLDEFGQINDALGHEVGDRVLRDVAVRLKRATRVGDILGRIGGDEFALVVTGAGEEQALAVAQRVAELLEAPCRVGEHRLTVRVSIGIVLFPQHGTELDDLMRKADAAMYRAKERRQVFCLFDPGVHVPSSERVDMATALEDALERGELELYYQPIYDFHDRRVNRAEGLIRWHHPVRGVLQAESFIPLAEDTGLIGEVDKYAIARAIEQAAAWYREGRCVSVAVNVSPKTFWETDVAGLIESKLKAYRLPARCLTLEVTERTLTRSEQIAPVLAELRQLGVQISIDNFGSGYSSLAHLRDFPLSLIKVDRTFIRDIGVGSRSEAIVRTVITLAHELGAQALAEGVECREQVGWLEDEGCDLIQGFYIGKPIPGSEFERRFLA